jgi:heat-inducible transcriptional repressor
VLSQRAETVLKSIVEQYISRPAPVPSQSIPFHCQLEVSPATIRNEMAYLEDEGFISRPHTSAGAVPSDRGYRYYVESLIDLKLPAVEQRLITHLFHQVEGELEEWLRLAASIIAQMVQNVAVVSRPKPTGCRLKHLELVSLQDSLVLVILVLHGAIVKQQLIIFDRVATQPELSTVAGKLNHLYQDLSYLQIQTKADSLSPVEQQGKDCMLKMMQAEDEVQYDKPYLDGLHFFVDQPEFTHVHQIQELMRVVERGDLLKVIMPPQLNTPEVTVVIGRENKAESIHNCSVVISQYGLHGEAVGTIGVVGPTRMPYAHAIPTVDYLSAVLGRLVAELYGKEYEGADINGTAR